MKNYSIKICTLTVLLSLFSSTMFAQLSVYVDASRSDNNGDGLSWATAKQTIPAAMSLVTTGGTVNIASGTYILTGRLTINKSISVVGQDETTTIIDASGNHTDWGILVSTSNVSLMNFTIKPPLVAGSLGTANGGGYAVHIANTPSILINITLSHITVTNGNRTGIDLNGVDNVSLSYITSQNEAYGNGISLTGVHGANLSFITTGGDAWGGLAVYDSPVSQANRGSDSININAPTCTITEFNKIYTQSQFGFSITNLNITGYDYSVRNNSFAGFTWYEDSLAHTITLATSWLDAALPGAHASSYIQQISTGYFQVAPGMSIQSAINAASSGNTVQVLAGTYSEQLVIAQNLHLIGAGVGSSIIQAPGTIPNSGNQASTIVMISGSGVNAEFTGFTVTGPGPSGCGSIFSGIFVRDGANANIHDNRIQDIRDLTFSGCQNGQGIFVGRQAWSTVGTATINHNTIVGYQKGGIVVDNIGSNAIITNNTINGVGTTTIIAQNGIQISRGATATLSGNTVTGNSYNGTGDPSSTWGSVGILLYQSGAVTLSGGNMATGNDQNLDKTGGSGLLTLGAESFGASTAPAGIGFDIYNDDSLAINATGVTFIGTTDGFAIENRVYHKLNDTTKGLVTWNANNVYVTPFSGSVQRGVVAASNGNNINVAAGTYNEIVQITKTLTLNGAQHGVAGGSHSGAESTITGFNITNADAVIDGFKIVSGSSNSGVCLSFHGGASETVQNNIITGYTSEGMAFFGTSGMLVQHNLLTNPAPGGLDGIFSGSGVSNNTQILNNVFTHASIFPGADISLSYTSGTNPVIGNNVSTGGATLIALFNSTGGQITNNSFIGDTSYSGSIIYIGGGNTNTTVSGNIVSGASGGGVAVKQYPGYGVNVATSITGNTISGNINGIDVGSGAINNSETIAAHRNILAGNVTAVRNLSGGIVDAANNYWGTAYTSGIMLKITGTGQITYTPWYLNLALTVLSTTDPTIFYVNSTYTDSTAGGHIFGYDAFALIADAVAAAPSGITINVGAGTYNESLTINKLVDISGAGIGVTTITGSVLINAGTGSGRVKLRNLSVITTDSPYKVDTRYAIFIDGSSGNTGPITIDSVKAKIYPSNPTVYGAGLLISPENNTIHDVVISHCMFDSSYSHGVYIKNAAGTTGTVSALQISNSSFNDDDRKIIAEGRSFSGYGLYILAPSASPTLIVDGLTVTNSTFNGNYRIGLYIESLKNASFNGVTATGNGEEGVNLNLKYGSYSNIAFNKCTFINNSTNGVTLNNGTKPDIHPQGRDDASYSGNPASLSNVSIASSVIGYASFGNNITSSPTLSENFIQSGIVNSMDSGTVVCTGNWWGTIDPAVISSRLSGSVVYSPWWNNNYMGDPHTSAWIWGVNSNLQSTIDSVQSGDTVKLTAGTYIEPGQIVINKNVSLVGANKATTIIKPGQNTGLGNHLDGSAWIVVNSGRTFNLCNVTLDGTGKFINLGILSHGHGKINNDSLTHIAYNQNGPDYQGTGIELNGSDMTVSNTSFDNMGRAGIYVGFGSTATITGNTFIGKGPGNFLDYGIEVGRNGHAALSNNTISGNLGIAGADGSNSAGILVSSLYNPETPSTATITGNSISHSTHGICISNGSIVAASSNTILNSAMNGIFLDTVSGNTITGNTILTSAKNGISLLGASNNTISSNNILACNNSAFGHTANDVNAGNAGWGIGFDGGSSNDTASNNTIAACDVAVENWNGSGNVVTGNLISGNFFGIHNHTSSIVLAAPNCWGNTSGPKNAVTNPAGNGDSVSANVVYSPWWGYNHTNDHHTIPWQWVANSNVQAAINAASPGDTLVFVGGTTPGNLVIPKNVIVKFQTPPVFDSVSVSGGDLALTSDIKISKGLNLTSGNMVTGDSNKIVFDTAATNPVETSNGRIIGTVDVLPRTVGTGSLQLLGLDIQPGSDNLGKVSFTRTSGTEGVVSVSGNPGVAVTWQITVDQQPVSGRPITFSWLSQFDNGVDTTHIIVYRNEGSGWQYYAGPLTATGNPRQVHISATGFSSWTIGSDTSFTVGVAKNNNAIPKTFALEQNFPNPFNPTTQVHYQLPLSGRVRLTIYDILGRNVVTLVDEQKEAGYYSVQFGAAKFSSGVYFARLIVESADGKSYMKTIKMQLIK